MTTIAEAAKVANSIQLAKLFIALKETQDRINNEILPSLGHLRADDDGDLTQSLEATQETIGFYLQRFQLQAVGVKL